MKSELKKLRNRLNPTDVFYTNSEWQTRQIDGVEFIPVVRDFAITKRNNLQLHYVRKDSLEKVK
jgi:hypothetical protein